LIAVGELARAARLTDLLQQRARALGRTSAIVAAARSRALQHAATGDVGAAMDELVSVDQLLDQVTVPLEVARTLIVRGQLQRRRKQKRAARDSLEQAVAICDAIGATLWAQRARSELARIHGVAEHGELTASEARVAELAASGLTNREIAAAAFMSQKTVEANLSRAYRKLGIRSRAELGLTLAGATPAETHRQARAPRSGG
jgi:DNA-binding CsgD family transcriptional regulator